MASPLLNFLTAQLGWFACVLSAANSRPMLGVAVALVIIGIHLSTVRSARSETALLLIAAAIGVVFDSMLVSTGWVGYPSGTIVEGLAPYWLVAMWPLFATTLNVSMAWLKGRPLAAAVLGGVFGPLAYRGGAALGAVEFIDPAPAYVALGIGWAIAMPLLLAAAARLNGVSPSIAGAGTALPGHSHV